MLFSNTRPKPKNSVERAPTLVEPTVIEFLFQLTGTNVGEDPLDCHGEVGAHWMRKVLIQSLDLLVSEPMTPNLIRQDPG